MRTTAPFSRLKNRPLSDKLVPLIFAKNENFQIDCPATLLRLLAVTGGFCLSTEYRVAALSCSQRHKDFTGTGTKSTKAIDAVGNEQGATLTAGLIKGELVNRWRYC